MVLKVLDVSFLSQAIAHTAHMNADFGKLAGEPNRNDKPKAE